MTLKVLATRDDGAQLIGDGNLDCALLSSDGGSSIMSLAAAASRGDWNWAKVPVPIAIPPHIEAAVRHQSAEFTANLAMKAPLKA